MHEEECPVCDETVPIDIARVMCRTTSKRECSELYAKLERKEISAEQYFDGVEMLVSSDRDALKTVKEARNEYAKSKR